MFSWQNYRPFVYGLIAGVIVGAVGMFYLRPPDVKTVTVTEKELVPQIIEKKVAVPYEVAKEIIREIPVAKETQKPVKDPDRVLIVEPEQFGDTNKMITESNTQSNAQPNAREPIKQYNIVLDRRKEIGVLATTESVGALIGYAPDKRTMVHIYAGQKYNGGIDVGAGVSIRF